MPPVFSFLRYPVPTFNFRSLFFHVSHPSFPVVLRIFFTKNTSLTRNIAIQKNIKSQLDGAIFMLYNEFGLSLQMMLLTTINSRLFILLMQN